jgi:GT2 family glycosyltransferase
VTGQVSVVIPTLRGRNLLPACLDALRAQTVRAAEIIVVDDGSTDGSAAYLQTQTAVRYLRNEANLGFAASVNRGIAAASTPFVAVLNDDTIVAPRWIEALRAEMTPSDVGACASLMVYAGQPELVQSAGISIDQAAIAWDRLAGAPVSQAREACDVFGASGGAALYRRAMLDKIGCYDERFFAYLEDADLAWRARNFGWRCRYAPDALVRHFVSATSGAGSPFKQRLIGRNKLWLALKNARVRELPLIAIYDVLAVVYAAITRRNLYHVRGRVQALREVAAMLAARQATAPRGQRPARLDPLRTPWRVARQMPRG